VRGQPCDRSAPRSKGNVHEHVSLGPLRRPCGPTGIKAHLHLRFPRVRPVTQPLHEPRFASRRCAIADWFDDRKLLEVPRQISKATATVVCHRSAMVAGHGTG
jgi:hypothetical protein